MSKKETVVAALNDQVEPCGHCGASVVLDEKTDGAHTGVMDGGVVSGKKWYWPVCNDACGEALIAKLVVEGRAEQHLKMLSKDQDKPITPHKFTVGEYEFDLDIRVVIPKRGESGRG